MKIRIMQRQKDGSLKEMVFEQITAYVTATVSGRRAMTESEQRDLLLTFEIAVNASGNIRVHVEEE